MINFVSPRQGGDEGAQGALIIARASDDGTAWCDCYVQIEAPLLTTPDENLAQVAQGPKWLACRCRYACCGLGAAFLARAFGGGAECLLAPYLSISGRHHWNHGMCHKVSCFSSCVRCAADESLCMCGIALALGTKRSSKKAIIRRGATPTPPHRPPPNLAARRRRRRS